jgi:hypothetical protein
MSEVSILAETEMYRSMSDFIGLVSGGVWNWKISFCRRLSFTIQHRTLDVVVVAPRPLPELWFGFAAKIEISFAYRLIQDVERQDEYTDLDGGTQRLKNHWSFAVERQVSDE